MLEFNKIKNIYLITTHKCNLKCKYCFVHQDMIDMPLNIAFDAIDFLVQHNGEENLHHTIQFFGGEPLLRWNDLIVPTVLYSKSKYPERNFSFSISSNCTLLTKDKINFLKEHKINILTSMDGNKSTQDFNRPFHNGKGSHEIVEKNIKYLLQEGYSPLFRATVIPETCNNLFNDYLYAQSLGYKKLFFITDGYTTWTKESLLILEEELNKIVTHYIQYFKINNKPFIHLTCIEKFFSKIYNDIQNIKHNLPIKNYTPELKCGYGQNHLAAVSATGDIYSCQELVTTKGKDSIFWMGDIYNGIDNSCRQKLLEQFRSEQKQGDMDCNQCKARSICCGGCIATNYSVNHYFRHNAQCHYYRLCYDAGYRILTELQDNIYFQKIFKLRSLL